MLFPFQLMFISFFLSFQLLQNFNPLLNQFDCSLLATVPHKDQGVGHGHEGEEHAQAEVEHETILGLAHGTERISKVKTKGKESVKKCIASGSILFFRNVSNVGVGSQEKAGAASSAI